MVVRGLDGIRRHLAGQRQLNVELPQNNRRQLVYERPPFTVLDWFAEALGLTGLIGGIGYLLVNYALLPNSIPMHFSSGGNPDRYGPKSELFIILGIVIVIWLTHELTARFLGPLEAWSVRVQPGKKTLNNPQFAATRSFLLWLNAELTWLFAFIFYETVRVGLGRGSVLNEPVLFAFLGIMGVTIVVYTIILIAYRPRRN